MPPRQLSLLTALALAASCASGAVGPPPGTVDRILSSDGGQVIKQTVNENTRTVVNAPVAQVMVKDGKALGPGGDLYPTLIRKNPINPIRIYLQDGDKDLSNEHGNWFLANQQMLSAFEYANAKADKDGKLGTRYEVKHQWGDGAHSDQHGGVLLPEILKWIWTND